MRIRNKILLLFFILFLMFVSILFILKVNDDNQSSILLQNTQHEKKAFFEKILSLKRTSLDMFVFESTYWDEMVKFVDKRDEKWAKETFSVAAQNYKLAAIWVYKYDWSLVYCMNLFPDSALNKLPFQRDVLEKILGKNRFCHFFLKSAYGFIEISGATIHPSKDINRKTDPKGFFLSGRLWNNDYIEEISKITECKIEVLVGNINKRDSLNSELSKNIEYDVPLYDWNNQQIALVKGISDNTIIQKIDTVSERGMIILLIFSIIFSIIFIFFGNRWILKPIKLISNSLKIENAGSLEPLKRDGDEFSEMASLIENFFKQKNDITERGYLLQAVAKASNQLLKPIDFEKSLAEALTSLGKSSRTDRIIIYENQPKSDNDEITIQEKFKWQSVEIKNKDENEGIFSTISNNFLNNWYKTLSEGTPVKGQVRDFETSIKEFLEKQHVQSILLVPILIEEYFWGFIRFDNIFSEKTWSETEMSILLTISGSIGGAYIRNDTEELLQRNDSLLRSTSSVAPYAFYVVDNNNDSILYCNDHFCDLWELKEQKEEIRFGILKNSEVVLHMSKMLFNPEMFKDMNVNLNDVNNRDVIEIEIYLNNDKIIRLYSSQIRDKRDYYFGRLFLYEDITERKHSDELIRKSEEELRELNLTKDKFFSIIAHDLRNPLGTVMAFTEFLVDNFDSMERLEIKDNLSYIKDSSVRALNLFENLLEWTRTQTGKIILQPVYIDLNQLTDEVVVLLKSTSDKKNIELINNIPEEVKAFADKYIIETVLRNLISNAIKYTRNDGKISVQSSKTSDMVELSISDSGIGMKPETVNKLFRVDTIYSVPGTLGEKGTGLGLVLCKEFVEKSGGKIWATSEIDKGSTFYFTLPVSE